MESGRILRVGLLCDSSGIQAWQARCLEEVANLPFASIVAVVVNCADEGSAKQSFPSRLKKVLRDGLLIWRLYERRVLARRSHAIRREPVPVLTEAVQVRCTPQQVGRFRQRLDDESIDLLRGLDLDVVIRFGFGILTGNILTVARHGLWSFHHGDPEHFRGAPPGFWEIQKGVPVTGAVLQRLTEKLDGGVILRSGWFKTFASNYPKSLDRLLFGATAFIRQALTELRTRGEIEGGSLSNLGPIYRYPKNRAMLVFFARQAMASARNQFASLFLHQQWSVGSVPMAACELYERAKAGVTRLEAVQWFPEQKGRFLADPFALPHSGEGKDIRILAEEFDWSTGLGQIAEFAVPPTGSPPRRLETRSAIRSQWHLSYPYVFELSGDLYCVPECAESNSVRLYRRTADSDEWEAGPVLLEGVAAVDPTIFFHDGRFWLLCTDENLGPNEALCAWYADDLLGPWVAHSLNPIKIDIRSARPAGPPFHCSDGLIRPAQDCSTRYGGGIRFNRMRTLTPDEFEEEAVGVLYPDVPGPYRSGLHTLCSAGNRTIVDGARTTWVPAQMGRAFVNKFRPAPVRRIG